MRGRDGPISSTSTSVTALPKPPIAMPSSDRDHEPRVAGVLEHGLLVERLDGVEMHDAGVDAVLLQHLGGREALVVITPVVISTTGLRPSAPCAW